MIKTVRTIHGRFRALLSDRDGASAVEFALIAPVLLAGLLGAVDVGTALSERMAMDHVLRSAAKVAMTDAGLTEVQRVLEGLADGEGFAVIAELYCPCPGNPACSGPCADPTGYNAYRLSASKTYESLITPLEVPLASAIEVQVR